ncbi:MAG: hypothetical protein J5882_05885, partial [Bacteroidales bacterium]|nr:hypothetical protein [Bacteroidales bacterium]
MKRLLTILLLVCSAALLYAQDGYRYDLLTQKSFHSALYPYYDTVTNVRTNGYQVDFYPLINIAAGVGDNAGHEIYSANGGVEIKAEIPK